MWCAGNSFILGQNILNHLHVVYTRSISSKTSITISALLLWCYHWTNREARPTMHKLNRQQSNLTDLPKSSSSGGLTSFTISVNIIGKSCNCSKYPIASLGLFPISMRSICTKRKEETQY